MKKLARYLKGYKKEVILGPFFKLLEAIFELIVPLVMADIIDVGIANGDAGYVWQRGGLMILLGAAGLGFALICQYFASRASQGVGTDIRNDLFRHICSLSHAEVDHLGTSSLVTRLTNDVNQVQVAVAMLIRLVVRAPFLVIGSAVMALLLDLPLSLIFFVAAPIIAVILYFVMSRSVPLYRAVQKKLDRISLITRENLSGVRVIRAFSRQASEKERFDEASEDLSRTAIRVGRLSALLNPATFCVMNAAVIGILWFGGMRVNSGALTQGHIIALVNYMSQILLALIVVANLVILFTKASACAARINEVFETTPSVRESTDAASGQAQRGAPQIELRHVSFSYSNSGENALTDISLAIRRGETIGIIGSTGSGKSTLVNLLPRFYDATAGEILIDGVPVKDYSLQELRAKFGVVPQRAVLFSGTIRDNMRWGDPDATDEEILAALEVSQSAEFVGKMPRGLDSVILQGGRNLSGGQKQRLSIARALVKKPPILILDDSASALDFATDAALRRAIRSSTVEQTVLIVSQRASSIKNADRIVVLDDGRIAGLGSHAELVEQCEEYREILLSQFSEDEKAQMQKGACC